MVRGTCTLLLLLQLLLSFGFVTSLTSDAVTVSLEATTYPEGFTVDSTPEDSTAVPSRGYYLTYDGTPEGEVCVFMDIEMEFIFEYDGTQGFERIGVPVIPDADGFELMGGNCTDLVQIVSMEVCGDWEVTFTWRIDMDEKYYNRIIDLLYYMRPNVGENEDNPCYFPNLPEDWDENRLMQTMLDNHRHFESDLGYSYECLNGEVIYYLNDVCGEPELQEILTADQRTEAFSRNKTIAQGFRFYEAVQCRNDIPVDYTIPIVTAIISFGIAGLVVVVYIIRRCRKPHVYESSKAD